MAVFSKIPMYGKVPAGQMIFTSSQTWTVPRGVRKVDIFCVGGGGSGRTGNIAFFGYDTDVSEGTGGGGGYTKSVFDIAVTPHSQVSVIVGAGGVGGRLYTGNSGGSSSFGSLCIAEGGKGGDSYGGAKGGSAGGDNYRSWDSYPVNDSGSNGGTDGGGTPRSPKNGQGTTTRAWGLPTETLYSGGGGGCSSGSGYSGGSGGGGAGGSSAYVKSGTANTGGGGGGGLGTPWEGQGTGVTPSGSGGSGIVIVRWKEQ